MFRWIWPGLGLALVVVGATLFWGFGNNAAGLVVMIAGGIWAIVAMIPAGIRGSAYSSSGVYENADIFEVEEDRP
jgi:hypothetical protein